MFCGSCGAELAGGSACARCGVAANAGQPFTAANASSATTSSGLSDSAAGALAYVTFIPAIIFLVSQPYSQRPFVRFHAFQSIFFAVAWTVVLIVLAFVPVVGWILEPLVLLAFFILWSVAVFQAYNGKQFHLPVIGDIAQKQAASL